MTIQWSHENHESLSRRWLLASGACATVAALGPLAAAAEKLRRTPTQMLGPFYPLEKPLDDDADMTIVKGHKERAKGQVVHVMGRVLNANGEPVKGARLEIWQANANGRYTHPSDDNPAPLDPNFEGYAKLLTDADGRYRFKTIKPAAYPAGDIMRPAHIHFDVAGQDQSPGHADVFSRRPAERRRSSSGHGRRRTNTC